MLKLSIYVQLRKLSNEHKVFRQVDSDSEHDVAAAHCTEETSSDSVRDGDRSVRNLLPADSRGRTNLLQLHGELPSWRLEMVVAFRKQNIQNELLTKSAKV